jgi:response regulator NasT
MERHSVDERDAFEMLRTHARSHSARVVDISRAVVDGHGLPPGSASG